LRILKKVIITIDGHSACGKSTLAKALANELNYGYIDTGAMYRAVTYFFLENRVNIQKTMELEKALKKIKITFKSTVGGNRTFLNGLDVEDTIRKMFVSKNVSHVAAISVVRKMVVKQQKEMGKRKGIVMEGRDIGTVVFPKAELKIFLTADEEVRVKRRFEELKNKGQRVSLKNVKSNLAERDHIDSTRKDSPLKKAKESVVIDNSNLTEKEQLQMVLALANERIRVLSAPTTPKRKATRTTNKPKPSAATKNTKAKANTASNKKTTNTTITAQRKNNQQKDTRKTTNTNTKSTTPKRGNNPPAKPSEAKTNQQQKSTPKTNTKASATKTQKTNQQQKSTPKTNTKASAAKIQKTNQQQKSTPKTNTKASAAKIQKTNQQQKSTPKTNTKASATKIQKTNQQQKSTPKTNTKTTATKIQRTNQQQKTSGTPRRKPTTKSSNKTTQPTTKRETSKKETSKNSSNATPHRRGSSKSGAHEKTPANAPDKKEVSTNGKQNGKQKSVSSVAPDKSDQKKTTKK
ncbi:MAG: (d)CMP kinase, partial [Bacteroidota bacterium]